MGKFYFFFPGCFLPAFCCVRPWMSGYYSAGETSQSGNGGWFRFSGFAALDGWILRWMIDRSEKKLRWKLLWQQQRTRHMEQVFKFKVNAMELNSHELKLEAQVVGLQVLLQVLCLQARMGYVIHSFMLSLFKIWGGEFWLSCIVEQSEPFLWGHVASPGVRGGFHGSDAQRAHVEAMRGMPKWRRGKNGGTKLGTGRLRTNAEFFVFFQGQEAGWR